MMESFRQASQNVLRLPPEHTIPGHHEWSKVHPFLPTFLRIFPPFLQFGSTKYAIAVLLPAGLGIKINHLHVDDAGGALGKEVAASYVPTLLVLGGPQVPHGNEHGLPVAGVERIPSVYHHKTPILVRLVHLPKEAVGMDGTVDASR